MRYHFTFTKVVTILEKENVGKYMEKLEPSHTAGVNVKLCGCFGKQSGSRSKEETGGITSDPAMPLPGRQPKI